MFVSTIPVRGITLPVPYFIWVVKFVEDPSIWKVPGAWSSFTWMTPRAILCFITGRSSSYWMMVFDSKIGTECACHWLPGDALLYQPPQVKFFSKVFRGDYCGEPPHAGALVCICLRHSLDLDQCTTADVTRVLDLTSVTYLGIIHLDRQYRRIV